MVKQLGPVMLVVKYLSSYYRFLNYVWLSSRHSLSFSHILREQNVLQPAISRRSAQILAICLGLIILRDKSKVCTRVFNTKGSVPSAPR